MNDFFEHFMKLIHNVNVAISRKNIFISAGVNPSLQLTSMLDLPQRMEGNRLHRFSKVLDTSSIGREHISTKILPKCPILDISIAEPLNRTGNYFTSLGSNYLFIL